MSADGSGSPGPSAAPGSGGRPNPVVAVVGGGISGLVAARELALAGAEVVLFEAEHRLGGRVRRDELAGVPFDTGAEAFATRGGVVAELLAELGLGDRIAAPAPLGSWVVAAAGAVPLPAAGTVGIPAAPLARDAVRALGLPGALRAAVEPLLPRSVGRGGSLAALVRARLGARVLERLVQPVVLGVYSAEPGEMRIDAVPGLAEAFDRRGSLIAAARELRDSRTAAGGAVGGLRGGMGELVDALAAELERAGVEVRTGVRVGRVEAGDGGGIRILAADPADPAAPLARPDAVILAVPESRTRALLGEAPESSPAHSDPDPADRDPAQGIPVPPLEGRIEIVALLVDDERLDAAPRGTGALVAADAAPGISAKALTHVTAKWPDRAAAFGPGQHLLRLSYGRLGREPETAGLSDEEVRELALRDASRILGLELRPDSVRGAVRRAWRHGSARRSLPSTSEASSVAGVSAPAGVVLTGDWTTGAGLASVVPAARAAARRALASVSRDASPGARAPQPHLEGGRP